MSESTYVTGDEPEHPFTLDEFAQANADAPILAEDMAQIVALDIGQEASFDYGACGKWSVRRVS